MKFLLNDSQSIKPRIAGLFLMPLRWVTAWILFASGWRRVVLKPEALDPHSPLYEGLKLNHFLAHAIWIKASLNYVVMHPAALLAFLWTFTILELSVGVLLFVGLGTRLLGLILIAMFGNLMLVAGWLGSTCLDEWTVATFGIGIGMCLLLAGSGPYSLDTLIFKRYHEKASHHLWSLLISPELSFVHDYERGKRYALILSAALLAFVLYTNQAIVGGVWGPFHNPAVSMNVRLHAALEKNGALALTLYRNQGPDTYGAFIVDVAVKDANGKTRINYDAKQLGQLQNSQIKNFYLVQAKSNAHALMLPLSALATLSLKPSAPVNLSVGNYTIQVTDVSGKSWETTVMVQAQAVKAAFDPYSLLS